MVEVQLNIPTAAEYKDHFLSLRVGDCQRIARLSGSRAFKFPAASVGTRKYGKVEVYRRVGTSTISICPDMATGTNDVGVPLETGAELCMTSSVSATDAKGLQKEKRAEMASAPKGESASQKVLAQYLDKHHLEVRLADAMQKVLRERPEDPAKMLADMLLTNACQVAKLPVPADEGSEPKAPPAPPRLPGDAEAPETTMKASAPVEEAAPRKPAEAAPTTMRPRSGEKKKAASKADTTPFGEYYQKNFALVSAEDLHKKFKAAPRLEFPVTDSEAPEMKKAVTKPFGAYYRTNFALVSAEGLYKNFKAAPRLDFPVTASEAPEMMLPSMGSFTGACAPFGGICRLKPSAAVAAEAPVAVPAVEPPAPTILPSMGSFQGGVGRFGGVLQFKVVTQVKVATQATNSTTSADGTHPHLVGKVRQIWEEAQAAAPAAETEQASDELRARTQKLFAQKYTDKADDIDQLRQRAKDLLTQTVAVKDPNEAEVIEQPYSGEDYLLPSMGSSHGPVGPYGGVMLLRGDMASAGIPGFFFL